MRFHSKIIFALALSVFGTVGKAQLIINTDQLNGGDFKDQQTVTLEPGSSGSTTITPNNTTNGHLFIDASISASPNYQVASISLTDIQNHQLDFSLPVGTIPGSYAVSSSGGLTYSIPITLPPGTHGMVPSVSIAYNSGSFGQVAGLGWGISGVSTIVRVPSDYYHDAEAKGVQLDATDNFEYNGTRMIQLQSSPKIIYGLENENFTRIQHVTSGATYGDYFLVETKDGAKIELGNSSTSKVKLTKPGGTTKVAYAYYVNKISDTYGNYVEYEYDLSTNEINLKAINYTGFKDNQGVDQPPYNSIRFYYNDRSSSEYRYKLGNLLESTKILREVEVLTEGVSTKSFDFTYSFNGKYHLLNTITETGSDGAKLNSTLVAYGTTADPLLTNATVTDFSYTDDGSGGSKVCGDYRIGDFNGDGLSDILAFTFQGCTVAVNSGGRFYEGWELYLNNGNSNFVYSDSKTYTPGSINAYASANYGTSWNHNPIGIQNGDFNGDGMEDMLLGVVPTSTKDRYDLYLSDGSHLTSTGTTLGVLQGSTLVFGDYNGDKKIEAMSILSCQSCNVQNAISFLYYDNGTFQIATDQLIGVRNVTTLSGSAQHLHTYNGFAAYDFDGDGITDLSAMDVNGHEVIIKIKNLKTVSGHAFFTLEEIYNSGTPTNDNAHLLYGDYNGDGLPDKVFLGHASVWMVNGTGTGFSSGSSVTGFPSYWQNMTGAHLSVDINGDGVSEIVYLDCSSGDLAVTATDMRSLTSQSYGTVSGITFPLVKDFTNFTPAYINHAQQTLVDANMDFTAGQIDMSDIGSAADDARPEDANKNPEFNIGDFNGDGYGDIMLKVGTSGDRMILYFNAYDKQNFVTHIVNGYNSRTDFDYEPLSTLNSTTFYTKGSGSSFPVRDFKGPLYAVSSIKEPDGVGGTTETTYSYEDAKLHLQGKGFLGFGKMTTTNNTSQFQKIAEYNAPDATHFVRLPNKTSAFVLPSTAISEKVFGSSIYSFSSGTGTAKDTRIFIKGDNITFTDKIRNVTDIKSFYYDGSLPGSPNPITDGNITYVEENNGNGTQTVKTTLDYILGGTTGWLQLSPNLKSRLELTTKEVTRLLPTAQPAYTRKTKQTYYNTGDVKDLITEEGDSKSVVTTNVYYSNNGVLQETDIIAPNFNSPSLPPMITKYEYDAKMRLPVKTTQVIPANDLVTQAKYAFMFGVPTVAVDVDGLVTLSSYDGFGRVEQVNTPDNLVTTHTINWYQPGSSVDIQSDPHSITDGLPLYYTQQSRTGSPTQTNIFDICERNYKSQTEGYNNDISNFIVYNSKGQVSTQYNDYVIGNAPKDRIKVDFTYTDLYQPEHITESNETSSFTHLNTIGYTYSGGNSTTTIHTVDGKTYTRVSDPIGALASATDAGGTLSYEYGSHGNPTSVSLNGTPLSTMTYDPLYGTQTQLFEVNSGATNYTHNAYGQLLTQTDARNNHFEFVYDEVGRIKTTSGSEDYDYQYVNAGNATGQLDQVQCQANGTIFKYHYDALSRLGQIDETVDGTQYSTQYQYDNFSNLIKQVYPSGFGITREYNSKGYATAIKRADNGNTIWQCDEIFRPGMLNKYTLGNGVQSEMTFDEKGFLVTCKAGGLQDLTFNFDNTNGNLNWITDNIVGKTENYQYDPNHDRLTQWQVVGGAVNNITYTNDDNGNILNKTEIGNYTYDTRPHAVKTVDNTNSLISGAQQDITYNAFNKVGTIIEAANQVDIIYGPDQERAKMVVQIGGQVTSTKYYLDDYEKEVLPNGNTREVHYIGSPSGLCAMYVNDNGSKNIYYVYTDHLGSINTLADNSGNTIKQNFDPWGRRRNPQTWDFTGVPTPPIWLTRGYTGHEHLPQFSLINMNGRMYDPLIARMLSPDNDVSDPASTQAHNRYSYCLNNPLKYVDPDGNNPLPGLYYGGANAILSPGNFDFSSFNPANADWAMAAELRQFSDDMREDMHVRLHNHLQDDVHENGKGGGPSERYSWTRAQNSWGGNSSITRSSLVSELSHLYTAGSFTGTPWPPSDRTYVTPSYGGGGTHMTHAEQLMSDNTIWNGKFWYGLAVHLEDESRTPPAAAYIVAGMNPLYHLGNIGWGIATDKDMHGREMSTGDYIWSGIGVAAPFLKGANIFGIRGGYGVFGKNGLQVGNYRMNLLYANPNAGRGAGTILSIKNTNGGLGLFRIDYGLSHTSGAMGLHSTFRFGMFGSVYGGTKQYPLLAPLNFWNYKRK